MHTVYKNLEAQVQQDRGLRELVGVLQAEVVSMTEALASVVADRKKSEVGTKGVKLKGVEKWSREELKQKVLDAMRGLVQKVEVVSITSKVVRVFEANPKDEGKLWRYRSALEDAVLGAKVTEWAEEGVYAMKQVEERVQKQVADVKADVTKVKMSYATAVGGKKPDARAPPFVPASQQPPPPQPVVDSSYSYSTRAPNSQPARFQGRGSGGVRCHNCQEQGHIARFCTQAQRCRRCKKEGHLERDCSEPRKCFGCGEVGHMRNACPVPETRKCHGCGQAGHLQYQCRG